MEEEKINPDIGNEPQTAISAPSLPQDSTDETSNSEAVTGNETAEAVEARQSPAEQVMPTADTSDSNAEATSGQQPAQPRQTYQLPPGYAFDQASGQIFFIGQTVQQPPAQPAIQQPVQPQQQVQQPQQAYQLPPGYAVDPASGQVFVGQTVQHPVQQPVQPGYVQPGVTYAQPAQQPPPEQIAAQQAAAQQRYAKVINTFEKFIEGEATVADVVKTLYTNTSQDDQLWKGAIVGAATAVLLTSTPVREAMGKTLGGVFPGLKSEK